MKKVEIKKIGTFSMFKTTVYFTIIPMSLIFVIGLLATIIGAATGTRELLFIGVTYLIMPIFMIALYGALSMLIALVYSKLANKFGGLVLTVEEIYEPETAKYVPYPQSPPYPNNPNNP